MSTPPLDLTDAADSRQPAWLRAWNRFWFAPIDPTGLGFLRVCAGLLILYTHLLYSYDLFSYFGPNPWLDAPAQNYIRKEVMNFSPADNWVDPSRPFEEKGEYLWSIFFHVHDPVWVVVIHVSVLVVLLLFTVGLWTRVTSVLAWMGAMCYLERLPTQLFGMDTMLIILLLYLMIGNSGAALSVDRWLERRRERREQGRRADLALKPSWSANFAIRLLQIHFCIIYLTSGLSKMLGPSWWNGTALWLCLANYNFAPMRVGVYNQMLIFLCQHRWLWELFLTFSTIFTLFTEISFTYLVWHRRTRPFMVSCSVMLHLGIGLIMGLTVFSLLMLAMVLAFVPPDTMRAWLDQTGARLRGRFTAKARPPASAAATKESLVLSRT